MNPIMGTIDQTGAVEAEDILINALRTVKEFPTRMANQAKAVPMPPKAEKTPEDPKAARELGFIEGKNEGKFEGYMEAISAFRAMLKTLNV